MRKQSFGGGSSTCQSRRCRSRVKCNSFFDSRTQASSYKPRDSEDFCSHPTSKPGHLWRGRMQTWFLQSAQQLLNRAVDRGAALCPGEQRGTRPQLALGTGCQRSHRSGRNIYRMRARERVGLHGLLTSFCLFPFLNHRLKILNSLAFHPQVSHPFINRYINIFKYIFINMSIYKPG